MHAHCAEPKGSPSPRSLFLDPALSSELGSRCRARWELERGDDHGIFWVVSLRVGVDVRTVAAYAGEERTRSHRTSRLERQLRQVQNDGDGDETAT